MPNRIGLSLLVLLTLTACGGQQTVKPPSYQDIVNAHKKLKMDAPEYEQYTVSGLQSVQCSEGTCTMSESDFRQNQHDKRTLLNLYKLSHRKDVARVQAYNSLVDAQAHQAMALAQKDAALDSLEQALHQERATNTIKDWVERILFIGGAYVFSTF